MATEGIGKKIIIIRIFIVFCLLLLMLLLACGYFLKKGIQIEELTFGGVTISDSNVIWDKKLELEISEISLNKKQKSSASKSEKSPARLIGQGIEYANYLLKVFSKLHIKNLNLGTTSVEIDLNQTDSLSNQLLVESDGFSFSSDLTFKKDSLAIEIIEASSTRFNTGVSGSLQLDGGQGELSGDLTALINKTFPVAVHFVADKNSLSFSGKEAGEITEINSLVDLFGLRHGIQRWITDYLKGSRYHLKSFNGIVPWKSPKEILNTLEAEVTVDDTEYTFAPGLEPIKAKSTDVSFRNGVLDIKPHDATFYGQDCGDSWVDINFNDLQNNLLTAYIKTRAVANDDILNLLNYYKIPLPFKQVGGSTSTNLELAIILNKKKITTQGIFDIEEGIIDWGGKNFAVNDARIKLVNSDITIERLSASYEDLISAQVKGRIWAKEKMGELDVTLERLNVKLGESQLSGDEATPLRVKYHFDRENHILDASPSSWLLDSLVLKLGAFRSPINLKDFSIKIEQVHLGTPPGIVSEISGYFSLKNMQADFTCDLLKYHVKDLELTSPHLAVDIKYDNGLFITTEETAEWELSKMPVTLFPSKFRYGDNIFSVVTSRLSYGELFDSYVDGYFSMKESKGRFSLQKIDITSKNLEERLKIGANADVEVNGAGGNYVVIFPAFDLKISTDAEKNWSAQFGDLSAVYSRSKILQKYGIKEGSLELSSKNGKRPYTFAADIKFPYPILVDNDGPVNALHITGQLTDAGTFAQINKDLDLKYVDKNLSIKSQHLGYNISAITKMIKERQQVPASANKTNTQTQPLLLTLVADESQIYLGPKSTILADNINLKLLNGVIQMELVHGPGDMSLQLEDREFVLSGTDLNDEFMGALIDSSRFQGGEMSMTAKGALDDFSAVFEIKDTLLSELATVNNVMAFINTVPALVTFSLPEYATRGFPIDSVAVGIVFKNKVATIESMEIYSPVLHAKGKGTINFTNKMIDMDVNLKTQAGKNLGKIPVLGYVLAGKDEDESLSLKIKGGLNDPDVDYSLVKNIVVYPAEILYRTLKLPFHLGGQIINESSEEANANSKNQEEKTP